MTTFYTFWRGIFRAIPKWLNKQSILCHQVHMLTLLHICKTILIQIYKSHFLLIDIVLTYKLTAVMLSCGVLPNTGLKLLPCLPTGIETNNSIQMFVEWFETTYINTWVLNNNCGWVYNKVKLLKTKQALDQLKQLPVSALYLNFLFC